MDSTTTIAVVTIICGMIVTVVQLIVRSSVISLINTVGEQTKELASLHQTVIAQSAKIYGAEATTTGLIEKVTKQAKPEDWTGNPPYRAK